MRDEDSLIRRIARAVPSVIGRARESYGLALGIGDDAAILCSGHDGEWAVSCDAFIEDVHFLADVDPAESVGYKALVRAASDLVAMGAAPRLFLLTLALPPRRTGRWLDDFLRGMSHSARYLHMRLAGGDTTSSATVSISVTVLGQLASRGSGRVRARGAELLGDVRGARRAITRSGGRPGDRVYVSGTLGAAQIGLELTLGIQGRMKRKKGKKKVAGAVAVALQPHLYPRLRVELGCWLAQNRVASAMMDLSDGLSSDLTRLCGASGVGAKVLAERVPAASPSPEISKLLPRRVDPLERTLNGGDDYQLLFTVPGANEKRLRAAPDAQELTCIGELTRDRRIVLVSSDGKAKLLKVAGWDPFRRLR
jgi:thiamine-monophosphate kinase